MDEKEKGLMLFSPGTWSHAVFCLENAMKVGFILESGYAGDFTDAQGRVFKLLDGTV